MCQRKQANNLRFLYVSTVPSFFLFLFKSGSSGFWSDKVCYLRLGFLRNVTRRHRENGGLLKQSNGSHGGTVGA